MTSIQVELKLESRLEFGSVAVAACLVILAISATAAVASQPPQPVPAGGSLAGRSVASRSVRRPMGQPDFGPNVMVVGPDRDAAGVQAEINRIYAEQQDSEFGPGRYAVLFKPGTYHLDIPVGFYTEVAGLGRSPDDVHILGNVHADAARSKDNATTTFWRGIEGVHITPASGTMQWAVSQATWLRRAHVSGDVRLHQNRGWASGGWLSDTVVDGTVDSGKQQQWLSRNADWTAWTGARWNMVFVGVPNAPAGDFPYPPVTRIDRTPVIREKPYLFERDGAWAVFVPALRKNTAGARWRRGIDGGRVVPLGAFHIAKAGVDTARTLNAALKAGKNLLFTPGTYDLTEALRVTRAGTILLGLGFATLHPVAGNAAVCVNDRDGVSVASLLFDAGPVKSPVLAEIGTAGSHRHHAADPIALFDVFFRVGGAGEGRVDDNLIIHSNDTLVDHTWIWRADHGAGVGWDNNLSRRGLVVTGNNVTVYGLFVEHHQGFQVDWFGERGRTYFYQSELPYDPPSQEAWRSAPGTNGWASYKVEAAVHDHKAWGLGVYSVFIHPDVVLTRAIEAPGRSRVRFQHVTTVSLAGRGEITHLVNDSGEATIAGPVRADRTLSEFPAD